MIVILTFLTKIVINESAYSVPLDTPITSFSRRHHRHRSLVTLHFLVNHRLNLCCVLCSVNTLTYCLLVDILTIISKTCILWEEIVRIKGVLLIQCYNQLTTPLVLIKIEDRLSRGVDYQIITGIYDSCWRDLPRTRLSANGRKCEYFLMREYENSLADGQSWAIVERNMMLCLFWKLLKISSKTTV